MRQRCEVIVVAWFIIALGLPLTVFAQEHAPGYSNLPDELRCSIRDFYQQSKVAGGGYAKPVGGAVGELSCWTEISGKKSQPKTVELVNSKFEDGFLACLWRGGRTPIFESKPCYTRKF